MSGSGLEARLQHCNACFKKLLIIKNVLKWITLVLDGISLTLGVSAGTLNAAQSMEMSTVCLWAMVFFSAVHKVSSMSLTWMEKLLQRKKTQSILIGETHAKLLKVISIEQDQKYIDWEEAKYTVELDKQIYELFFKQ